MYTHRTFRRTIVHFMAALIPVILFVLPAAGQHSMDRDTSLTGAEWEAFNEKIVEAVHSDNEGIREGALVQIAYYGDYLDFPELTVFEVMRMYRDHDDPQIQRLAIVCLANMGSRWAIEFLDMLAPYESNETLKQTMEDVVREARAEMDS